MYYNCTNMILHDHYEFVFKCIRNVVVKIYDVHCINVLWLHIVSDDLQSVHRTGSKLTLSLANHCKFTTKVYVP